MTALKDEHAAGCEGDGASTRLAPGGGDAGAPEQVQAWSRVLSLLARAIQAVRLYDERHARAMDATAEFGSSLAAVSGANRSQFIGVNDRGFWLGEDSVTADEGVRGLASAISRRDVAGLEWSGSVAEHDAARVVNACVRLTSGASENVLREWPEGLGVRLVPLGAHGLEFVRGTSTGARSDDEREAWRGVWKSILEGGAATEETGLVALASGRVRECLRCASDHERSAALSLLSKFVGGGAAMSESATDGHAIGVEREKLEAMMVEAAIEKMSPELRASILGLGAASGAEWITFLASGSESGGGGRGSMQAEIAAALVVIDQSGAKPPDATLQLLSKMVGLSELSVDVRRECEGLAAKWGGGGLGGVSGLVKGLMSSEGANDYCPEDYRENLNAVAKWAGAAVVSSLSMADFEEASLFGRMADIAEYLCEHPGVGVEEASQSGAVGFVAEHAVRLAGAGRLGVIWKAWELSEDVQCGQVDGPTKARLRTAMGERGVVDELLRGDSGEIERVAKIMPRLVLEELAGRVRAGRISPGHETLRVAVLSCDVKDVVAVGRAEVAENLAGVTAILEHVREGAVCEAAWRVADGQSRQVRGAVIGVIDRRLVTWTGEMIERAVQDPGLEVMELGVRRLMESPKGASARVLVRVLMGETTGAVPGARVTGAIVHALAMQGEDGVRALSELLTAWSSVVKKDHLRVCRRIAEELEARKDVAEAARALKAWRRSVGHAISLFVGEASERTAA